MEFDGRETEWRGLWWHQAEHAYTSETMSFDSLKVFDGGVKLYLRRNREYDKEKNTPNFFFQLRGEESSDLYVLEAMDESELYRDGERRFFTRDEVERIMRCAFADGRHGLDDDLKIEDYLY